MSEISNDSFDAHRLRKIREMAHSRLRQFSKSPKTILESYLFHNDHVVGVRFRLAFFHADWRFGDDQIVVSRGENEVARLDVSGSENRRVA